MSEGELGSIGHFYGGDIPKTELTPSLEMQTEAARPDEDFGKSDQERAETIRRNLGEKGEGNPALEQALARFEDIQSESLKAEMNGLFEAVNKRYKLDQERLINPEKVEKVKDFLSKVSDTKIWRNITIGGVVNFAGGWVIGAQAKAVGRKMLFAAGVKGAVAAAALGATFGAVRAGWRENRKASEQHFGMNAWEAQLEKHKDSPEEQMAIIRELLANPEYKKYLKANAGEAMALMGRYQAIALTLEEKRLEEALQNRQETAPAGLSEYLKTASVEKRRQVLKAVGRGAAKGAIIGLAGFAVGHFFGSHAEAQGAGMHAESTEAPNTQHSAAGIPKFVAPVQEPAPADISSTDADSAVVVEHETPTHIWHDGSDGTGHLEYSDQNHEFVEGKGQESIVKIETDHASPTLVARQVQEALTGKGYEGEPLVGEGVTDQQMTDFEKEIATWIEQNNISIEQGQTVHIPAEAINDALEKSGMQIDEDVVGKLPFIEHTEPPVEEPDDVEPVKPESSPASDDTRPADSDTQSPGNETTSPADEQIPESAPPSENETPSPSESDTDQQDQQGITEKKIGEDGPQSGTKELPGEGEAASTTDNATGEPDTPSDTPPIEAGVSNERKAKALKALGIASLVTLGAVGIAIGTKRHRAKREKEIQLGASEISKEYIKAGGEFEQKTAGGKKAYALSSNGWREIFGPSEDGDTDTWPLRTRSVTDGGERRSRIGEPEGIVYSDSLVPEEGESTSDFKKRVEEAKAGQGPNPAEPPTGDPPPDPAAPITPLQPPVVPPEQSNENKDEGRIEVEDFDPQELARMLGEEGGPRNFLERLRGEMKDRNLMVRLGSTSNAIQKTRLRDVSVVSIDPDAQTLTVAGREGQEVTLNRDSLDSIRKIKYEPKSSAPEIIADREAPPLEQPTESLSTTKGEPQPEGTDLATDRSKLITEYSDYLARLSSPDKDRVKDFLEMPDGTLSGLLEELSEEEQASLLDTISDWVDESDSASIERWLDGGTKPDQALVASGSESAQVRRKKSELGKKLLEKI